MNHITRILLVAVCLLPASLTASDVDPEWREPVERIAALVAELSAGEVEAAWQKFRVMLPEPPLSPKTPFDPDPYQQFQEQFTGFPREIESLSLIAKRPCSPQSARLYFVAETKIGPVMIESFAHRYKGEWFFLHLGYQKLAFADANWYKQHEDLFPVNRLAEPISVTLPKSTAPMEQAKSE